MAEISQLAACARNPFKRNLRIHSSWNSNTNNNNNNNKVSNLYLQLIC